MTTPIRPRYWRKCRGFKRVSMEHDASFALEIVANNTDDLYTLVQLAKSIPAIGRKYFTTEYKKNIFARFTTVTEHLNFHVRYASGILYHNRMLVHSFGEHPTVIYTNGNAEWWKFNRKYKSVDNYCPRD